MKATDVRLGLLAIAFCLPLAPVHAGTTITTNLPTGTSIVNIDATFDGAANYTLDPAQSFWYQPINGVQLTVGPGTYQFRLIDPTDAAALYPSLTSGQLSQIYTGWTYNSPWIENYMVFNSTALTDPNEHQLFDGALDPAGTSYGSDTAAYMGTILNGYYDKIRPAPPGRAGTSPSDYRDSWTFTSPTTLVFIIPDNILVDNTGGVSVAVTAITAAAPEPGALALAVTGLLPLIGIIQQRRKVQA